MTASQDTQACERDAFLSYAAGHPDTVWIAKPSAGSKGAGDQTPMLWRAVLVQNDFLSFLV